MTWYPPPPPDDPPRKRLTFTVSLEWAPRDYATLSWQCPHCPHNFEGTFDIDTLLTGAIEHLRLVHQDDLNDKSPAPEGTGPAEGSHPS